MESAKKIKVFMITICLSSGSTCNFQAGYLSSYGKHYASEIICGPAGTVCEAEIPFGISANGN